MTPRSASSDNSACGIATGGGRSRSSSHQSLIRHLERHRLACGEPLPADCQVRNAVANGINVGVGHGERRALPGTASDPIELYQLVGLARAARPGVTLDHLNEAFNPVALGLRLHAEAGLLPVPDPRQESAPLERDLDGVM